MQPMGLTAKYMQAKQTRLYLKAQPIIDAANKIPSNIMGEYGFSHGWWASAQKYRSKLQISLQKNMGELNNTCYLGLPPNMVSKHSFTLATSLIVLKSPSLVHLSERGILPANAIEPLSRFSLTETIQVAQSGLDMILEYQNAKLSLKHQTLMLRRFLPVSYLNLIIKDHGLSKYDVLFFINKKTFPHIDAKEASMLSATFSRIYGVSFTDSMHYIKRYDEPEEALKNALYKADHFSRKYKISFADALFFVKRYTKSDIAIKKALETYRIFIDKHNVPPSDAIRLVKVNKDPEKALIEYLKNRN